MAKRISETVYDGVITDKLVYGKTNAEIASKYGIGEASVSVIARVHRNVTENNWEDLMRMARSNVTSSAMVQIAADRCGVTVPEDVFYAFEARNMARMMGREAAKQEPEPEKEPEQKPEKKSNEEVLFLRILEQLNELVELQKQYLDVVIPHYVGDLKDNANANNNAIHERLNGIETALDSIRCNTRKRGM